MNEIRIPSPVFDWLLPIFSDEHCPIFDKDESGVGGFERYPAKCLEFYPDVDKISGFQARNSEHYEASLSEIIKNECEYRGRFQITNEYWDGGNY